jgi:hypothetical protein
VQHHKPVQLATAQSTRRVCEPWVCSATSQARAAGVCHEILLAHPGLRCRPLRGLDRSLMSYPRLADSPWALRCRPLRGLAAEQSHKSVIG